ncbi:MAG: ATP-binding protein [Piscinibacter sp.]|nr:ATP-binding protein [Piscinibacter sp.]
MNARADVPLVPVGAADWSEANQRWLAAELARLHAQVRARLEPDAELAPAAFEPTPWPQEAVAPPALERVARIFGLSRFERELLLLAAGIELDRGLRALLPAPLSFSLALSLLDAPHWDALSPLAPLRQWRLLELGAGPSPAHAALSIDERVLHALTGVAAIDERLRAVLRPAAEAAAADVAGSAAVAEALAATERAPLVLVATHGGGTRSPAVVRDTAVAGVRASGAGVLLVSIADLPHDAAEADDLARRLDREALLSDAVPVLWGHAGGESQQRLCGVVDRLRGAAVLAGEQIDRGRLREAVQRPLVVVECASPTTGGATAGADGALLRPVLQQFRVDAALLQDARTAVALRGVTHADGAAYTDAVWAALREAARGGLESLAQRIDGDTRFADLVLPAAQLEQLRAIAAQLQHRHTVHDDWGFAGRTSRGLGIAALFAGESGTGKTMAAEAIANEVRLDLFRIDLASTVSKYIGETEKNLARVFDAAEASGAVLLFDEADALFGKRSEVKDSHDRYANIEIAYLLQRIEAYRGLAILTTNLKSSLDKAFMRRIRFVVQFPFPDESMREQLWRLQLPAKAPQAPIDYAALARAPLSGGHIRAAALQAAFAAAARGQAIDNALLTQALRGEFAKLERSWNLGAGGA